jgi:hypothetical protein
MRVREGVETVSLLQALRERRSRRFGLGMRIEAGPLAYASRHAPRPLDEGEEALLAFAAAGPTGYALADLTFARGEGGNIMSGLVGRTVASGDAAQAVALVVSNDSATYLVRRPREMSPAEVAELIGLAGRGDVTEVYRRSRVKIKAGRATAPVTPMFNLNVNAWSLHAPGSTYFLPINDLTLIYINGLLDIFNESTGAYVVDERAGFRPAGLARFAKSRGGHLADDPRADRTFTVQRLEVLVTEVVTIEQGMMLQNLGLAAEAMGLGGFPHFAAHEYAWFGPLGFRMLKMPASRYLGAGRLLSAAARLLGRDRAVPYAVGLEVGGEPLLRGHCPPYFDGMAAAVRAVADAKCGPSGLFRAGIGASAWSRPDEVSCGIPDISDAAVAATTAYCDYVYRRYGRFPAYLPPFRTVLGFQATHLDVEFYDRFYRSEALTPRQRRHLADWHGA